MEELFANTSRGTLLRTGLRTWLRGDCHDRGFGDPQPASAEYRCAHDHHPTSTGPVNAPNPASLFRTLSAADTAILRFTVANELVGGDLWSQYGNQVLYNPAFTSALRAIDPMLPRYVLDTVRDELSHGAFLTALSPAIGVEPVNLDVFRTLPGAGAAALVTAGQPPTDTELVAGLAGLQAAGVALPPAGTRRLVNLTQRNIDAKFSNKYRTANNPDVQPEAPSFVMLQNQPTLPQAPGVTTGNGQSLAAAALLHMSLNEQTESGTYAALGTFLQNRELLGLMLTLLPVEMMHYTAFQTSVAKIGISSRRRNRYRRRCRNDDSGHPPASQSDSPAGFAGARARICRSPECLSYSAT